MDPNNTKFPEDLSTLAEFFAGTRTDFPIEELEDQAFAMKV